ncbi:MAG: hypothetical protein WCO84_01890 [bacterium]
MRSIERRFKEIENKDQGPGTVINFGKAVVGQNFSHKIITMWFNKLVDPDDYLKSEKKGILAHLDQLTKMPEEVVKLNKFEIKGTPFIKVAQNHN